MSDETFWENYAYECDRIIQELEAGNTRLEADLRKCAAWLKQNTATIEMARARIEALEAALRFILTDPVAALDEPDTDAEVIQHYREVARAALAPEQDKTGG